MEDTVEARTFVSMKLLTMVMPDIAMAMMRVQRLYSLRMFKT